MKAPRRTALAALTFGMSLLNMAAVGRNLEPVSQGVWGGCAMDFLRCWVTGQDVTCRSATATAHPTIRMAVRSGASSRPFRTLQTWWLAGTIGRSR